MIYPPAKFDVLFINPSLTGLYAALITSKLGATVGIIHENTWSADRNLGLSAFPHCGTFRPAVIDTLAIEAGIKPPEWIKIPGLTMKIVEYSIVLNSDDGPGGLLLALTRPFAGIREIITPWLSSHIEKSRRTLNSKVDSAANPVKTSAASVAEHLEKIQIDHKHDARGIEIANFQLAIDTLARITTGSGIAEIDIESLPDVFATFLNGWHIPEDFNKDLIDPILGKINLEGIGWYETGPVESVELHGDSGTLIETADEQHFLADIIVGNENDRFSHPSRISPPALISWLDVRCDISATRDDLTSITNLGVIRPDPDRPPINDNFVSWRLDREGKSIVISSPTELRFLENGIDRYEMIVGSIVQLASDELGLTLEGVSRRDPPHNKDKIILPGKAIFFPLTSESAAGIDLIAKFQTGRDIAGSITDALRLRSTTH